MAVAAGAPSFDTCHEGQTILAGSLWSSCLNFDLFDFGDFVIVKATACSKEARVGLKKMRGVRGHAGGSIFFS